MVAFRRGIRCRAHLWQICRYKPIRARQRHFRRCVSAIFAGGHHHRHRPSSSVIRSLRFTPGKIPQLVDNCSLDQFTPDSSLLGIKTVATLIRNRSSKSTNSASRTSRLFQASPTTPPRYRRNPAPSPPDCAYLLDDVLTPLGAVVKSRTIFTDLLSYFWPCRVDYLKR